MIIKNILFIVFFILISAAHSVENKILIKIDNDIITSIDILNEVNYLIAINKDIKKLEKNRIYEIAKNTVIRDKIKKNQILKVIKKIDLDKKYIAKIIESTALKLGHETKKDFENYMLSSGIKIDLIEKKISLEILWNELIFQKFSNQLAINEEKILQEIKSNNKKVKSFLLSEIVINLSIGETINQKFEEIKKNIIDNGFENAALIHSASNTSSAGGKLGWISENAMNKKIKKEILRLKPGEYTEPMVIPGGFLILKLENLREDKMEIDVKKELKKLVALKKQQQLNQFSNIYYNKIKKDIIINEL